MLDAKAFGLAGGLLWGLVMVLMTVIGIVCSDYGKPFFDFMMAIYPGYQVSAIGAVIGLAYGFVDAFLGCFLMAWLYNRFCGSNA